MNRREFLERAFRLGGVTALIGLGISYEESKAIAGIILGRRDGDGGGDFIIGRYEASPAGSDTQSGAARAEAFSSPGTGSISHAGVYTYTGDADNVSFALYDASNNLLGASNVISDNLADGGWNVTTFPTTINVNNGTTYKVALFVSSAIPRRYTSSSNCEYYSSSPNPHDPPPDPWSPDATDSTQGVWFFVATYDPTA